MKISAPKLNPVGLKNLADILRPPDASATAAMKELLKNNPGNKSISGQEMADAISKGTRDPDNQAAGREYTVIKQFVDKNGAKLSPEAKKVFEVYKKQVELAKANGQTGIEARAFAKMERDMQAAGKPQYLDKSAAEQLNDLAKGNKVPGSISGREMTDAIIKGTQDTDNQAAGKEFRDISKFVRENAQLLSPEAKAAYAVYEKAARAAQAKGQTGIEDSAFKRMARDMAKAGAPRYQDASMGKELNALAAKDKTPGSISAKDLADAVNKGARDLDGQSAGTEFKDLAKFVKENEQLLSPDAKQAYAMYEKAAKAANAKGSTSVGTLEQFDKLIKDMGNVGVKPPVVGPPVLNDGGVDASAAKAMDELGRANPGPGSISGKEMAAAIKAGTEDLDNQAAGSEYKQIAKFVKDHQGQLSPEAKAAFAVYEKAAKAARAQGETGIPTPIYNKMVKEMEAAGQPRYQDASMGDELNKLAAANTTPGSVTAKQLAEAINKGARDLDGNSAGIEFEDLAKFVAENQQLLTPDAKAAFAMYEKAAMAAREKGSTSVGTLEQFDKLIKDMGAIGTRPPAPPPPPVTTAPPAPAQPPLPGGLTPPAFPGPNATPADLAKFLKDLQKFFEQLLGQTQTPQPGTPAPSTGTPAPSTGTPAPSTGTPAPSTTSPQIQAAGTIEDKAAAALGALQEPPFPGKDATEAQLAQFQKDLGKYNRMYEMMSKVMANAHEMKKALIGNLPR